MYTDDEIKAMAERHWNNYLAEFLIRFAMMHQVTLTSAELAFHKYNYVSSAIHFAKHQAQSCQPK